MSECIDYYFWINSDWAYFGNPRLKSMAARHGLTINYYPVDITAVYARTGGIKLQLRSKERKDYRLLEMRRFRDLLGMPINLEPKFMPATGQLPSYFVIAAQQRGIDVHDLVHAIMTAVWVEDRDIENEATLVAIADGLGLDGQSLLKEAGLPAPEKAYFDYTNRAIERGMFGAPFYFFRDEAFWGQDRLDYLDRVITDALGAKASGAKAAQSPAATMRTAANR
jgi:2-hydroxychromene-2-carboxylate isomerase